MLINKEDRAKLNTGEKLEAIYIIIEQLCESVRILKNATMNEF